MNKNIEEIYDDFLYDCYLANKFLTEEDWLYYGRERHHIEVPNRDNGLLTPLNSQDLTTYQHWIAGVLQSEVRQKCCFAYIPKGALPLPLEPLRIKWIGSLAKEKDIRGERNPMYGRNHSEESRRKISKNRKGKGHTEESRKKISIATKGENNPMYGRTHSEEARRSIANHSRNRIMPQSRREFYRGKFSGEGNPMYGVRGEQSPSYGKKWWVNETNQTLYCKDCPGPGWKNGRTWK